MSSKRQWLYRQSGVIPVFEDSIVLITTRRSKRWIIPKGVVEKGMTPPDSAAKEAFEEAGLIGSVHDFQIGTFRYRKLGGTCTVQVYPLFVEQVLDEWEEMHMRKRKVVSVREAVKMVQHEELSRIISGFFRHVKGS